MSRRYAFEKTKISKYQKDISNNFFFHKNTDQMKRTRVQYSMTDCGELKTLSLKAAALNRRMKTYNKIRSSIMYPLQVYLNKKSIHCCINVLCINIYWEVIFLECIYKAFINFITYNEKHMGYSTKCRYQMRTLMRTQKQTTHRYSISRMINK